jgi:DNA-binding transcriptional ArsR family regulator
MMDLNKMVNDSLAKIEAEGYVEKVVEKRLKETIASIVDDLFRSYSDFGKELEKEVKAYLSVDLKKLNLTGYNVMVLNAVQEELDKVVHIQGVEKIKESLVKLLSNPPKEYKLSELIDEFKRDVLSDDSDYEGREISFHFKREYGSIYISFDRDDDKSEYRCQYRIWVEEDGSITTITINDKKFDNKVIMGGLWGFDKTLFKIYTSGTKIIMDDGDVDIEYGSSEEDD